MPRKTHTGNGSMLMLKSTLYRFIGTPALIAILIAATGDVRLSLTVGVAEFMIKLIIYPLFEKFWDILSYRIKLWKNYSE